MPPRKHEGPVRKVSAVVANGAMVDVFDALCLLEGRKPHELVHDAVLEYCQTRQYNPGVVKAIELRDRFQRRQTRERLGLTVVDDGGL